MKKLFYFFGVVAAIGGAYLLYANIFSTRITITEVSMPNVSFKYSNVPQEGTSIVFFNQDTGNSYVAAVRMDVSGETTIMTPIGMPPGMYSLRLQNNQTLKKLAESDVFSVGTGAKPIVSIDKNTLTAATHNPILSGTAKNISDISILVEDGAMRRYFGSELDIAPTNGGTWSIGLTEKELPNGKYTVKIFNSRDESQGILASEMLIVSAQ